MFFDFEGHSLEIFACAAAIRDLQGKVVTAVVIVGLAARVHEKLKGEYSALVKDAAGHISRNPGYNGRERNILEKGDHLESTACCFQS